MILDNKSSIACDLNGNIIVTGVHNNAIDIYQTEKGSHMFEYIYDNDTYDIKSYTINNNPENKRALFFAIVAYLLSKTTVLNILYKTIYLDGCFYPFIFKIN